MCTTLMNAKPQCMRNKRKSRDKNNGKQKQRHSNNKKEKPQQRAWLMCGHKLLLGMICDAFLFLVFRLASICSCSLELRVRFRLCWCSGCWVGWCCRLIFGYFGDVVIYVVIIMFEKGVFVLCGVWRVSWCSVWRVSWCGDLGRC